MQSTITALATADSVTLHSERNHRLTLFYCAHRKTVSYQLWVLTH